MSQLTYDTMNFKQLEIEKLGEDWFSVKVFGDYFVEEQVKNYVSILKGFIEVLKNSDIDEEKKNETIKVIEKIKEDKNFTVTNFIYSYLNIKKYFDEFEIKVNINGIKFNIVYNVSDKNKSIFEIINEYIRNYLAILKDTIYINKINAFSEININYYDTTIKEKTLNTEKEKKEKRIYYTAHTGDNICKIEGKISDSINENTILSDIKFKIEKTLLQVKNQN